MSQSCWVTSWGFLRENGEYRSHSQGHCGSCSGWTLRWNGSGGGPAEQLSSHGAWTASITARFQLEKPRVGAEGRVTATPGEGSGAGTGVTWHFESGVKAVCPGGLDPGSCIPELGRKALGRVL